MSRGGAKNAKVSRGGGREAVLNIRGSAPSREGKKKRLSNTGGGGGEGDKGGNGVRQGTGGRDVHQQDNFLKSRLQKRPIGEIWGSSRRKSRGVKRKSEPICADTVEEERTTVIRLEEKNMILALSQRGDLTRRRKSDMNFRARKCSARVERKEKSFPGWKGGGKRIAKGKGGLLVCTNYFL